MSCGLVHLALPTAVLSRHDRAVRTYVSRGSAAGRRDVQPTTTERERASGQRASVRAKPQAVPRDRAEKRAQSGSRERGAAERDGIGAMLPDLPPAGATACLGRWPGAANGHTNARQPQPRAAAAAGAGAVAAAAAARAAHTDTDTDTGHTAACRTRRGRGWRGRPPHNTPPGAVLVPGELSEQRPVSP